MSAEQQESKQFTHTMPEKVYASSTPIKRNFDPISKNNSTMNYQKIYPGIYLTSVKNLCTADDLKIFGFTHIIYIDKHVIQNDTVTQNDMNTKSIGQHLTSIGRKSLLTYAGTSITASITIKNASESNVEQNSSSSSSSTASSSSSSSIKIACSSSIISFDHHEMPIDMDSTVTKSVATIAKNENIFGHRDFKTLDLNFGESSYLTTVLPNCYKAVKFIEKALKNNGAVLVIDCIGESQKCITIVIGFLMYKYNKNFLTAYQLIKRLHPNLELDKFFTTQLYEYEPILQVQRSQLGGNSCSRELRSAMLKRKKTHDDCYYYQSNPTMPTLLPHDSILCNGADNLVNNMEITTDILMEQ